MSGARRAAGWPYSTRRPPERRSMAARFFASATGPRTTGKATVVAKVICPVRLKPSVHRATAGERRDGRLLREPESPRSRLSAHTQGGGGESRAACPNLSGVGVHRSPLRAYLPYRLLSR